MKLIENNLLPGSHKCQKILKQHPFYDFLMSTYQGDTSNFRCGKLNPIILCTKLQNELQTALHNGKKQ